MKSATADEAPGSDPSIPPDGAPNRGPTVLQVLPRLDGGGGVERGTLEISRALVHAGWRSIIASAGETDPARASRAGAIHAALPVASKNPFRARATIRQLAELIETENVDLVHARSRAPAWLAYFAARRTGRPFMTTFHGTYSVGNLAKRRYNAIMTQGARVIAISEFIAHHMAQTYRVDPDKVRVVPRGADLSIFDPDRVSPERIIALARNWRVPEDGRVILLPGRLTQWKGQSLLIEALGRIDDKRLFCLLVGGNDANRPGHRRRLTRQIEELGIGHQVRMTGECRDMPAAYMLADVVVSASIRPEAFGRVIVEAQAMGRPVVAADHGGARETVLPGKTGWLVPPGDADALRQAIRDALALSTDQRDQMAQDCREHIQRNFALTGMCAATLDVYRELLPQAAASS